MMDTCSTAKESFTTVAMTNKAKNNISIWGKGVDIMFVKAVVIFPPSEHEEFEMNLWENRPNTEMEAIDRAIVLLY